jgi:hypothetical protein
VLPFAVQPECYAIDLNLGSIVCARRDATTNRNDRGDEVGAHAESDMPIAMDAYEHDADTVREGCIIRNATR